MPFFVLVTAYLIRRSLDAGNRLDCDRLWRRVFRFGARTPAAREGQVWPAILLVALLALLLLTLEAFLRDRGWTAPVALIDLIGLVLLMGAPGWREKLVSYTQAWGRGDLQGAWHHVQELLPADKRGESTDPEHLHLALSAQLLTRMFERYFLILFWYVVGGLPVAFLVRAVVALSDHWPRAQARPVFARVAQWLAWAPVRLLSFTFGLAGDLSGWLRDGRRTVLSLGETTRGVLLTAANSALTGYALDPLRFARLHPDDWADYSERSLAAVRDLLNRSMLIWICVLALLVIAGLIR